MCLSIVACFCPPLAVCFKRGCGVNFCVAILLTLLGWFPGCCFACHIIHKDGKGGGNVITNVQVAPAQAPHVTVNLAAQQQYPGVHGPTNGALYPNVYGPMSGSQYPSPMNMPPPMYNSASALPPPYYYGDNTQQGQGDNNMQK